MGELGALPGVSIEAKLPIEPLDCFLHIPVNVTLEGEMAARSHPRVVALEQRKAPEREDEVADLIISGQVDAKGRPVGSYLRWLDDNGVSGLGVAIGIVDAGVDASHVAFQGRIKDLTEGTRDWHGTFVAGNAAGAYMDEKDGNGFFRCGEGLPDFDGADLDSHCSKQHQGEYLQSSGDGNNAFHKKSHFTQ